MTPVSLADLPVIRVDPERWRQRHVARQLVGRDKRVIADRAGLCVDTIRRFARGEHVSPDTTERIEFALQGRRVPPTTQARVQDMRNTLNTFLARIHKQPIGAH